MARRTMVLLWLGLAVCAGRAAAAEDEGWIDLFDGKTLTGWHNPYGWGKAEAKDGENFRARECVGGEAPPVPATRKPFLVFSSVQAAPVAPSL